MISIQIFDLQIVGQGHELQHRRIRRWLVFCGLEVFEKQQIYLNLFFTGSPTWHTHL